MKGVILAGGYGTRLRPLTLVVSKHLLPIYDKPMISYPLTTLRKSGIEDVLVVSEASQLEQFSKFLKSGDEYGLSISYAGQSGAGGIAEALNLAKSFSDGGSLAVILGDNIFEDHFGEDIKAFKSGAKVFLKKVPDPQSFGVAVFVGERVSWIDEKPAIPSSEYAATGFYLFDQDVFGVINELKPSGRGELEITDAVNTYAKKGILSHKIVNGFWTDAGTSFDHLLASSWWVANRSREGMGGKPPTQF